MEYEFNFVDPIFETNSSESNPDFETRKKMNEARGLAQRKTPDIQITILLKIFFEIKPQTSIC